MTKRAKIKPKLEDVKKNPYNSKINNLVPIIEIKRNGEIIK